MAQRVVTNNSYTYGDAEVFVSWSHRDCECRFWSSRETAMRIDGSRLCY